MSGITNEYSSYNYALNYYYNLSLSNALDPDLYNMGTAIGFPWPYITNPDTGLVDSFTFSDAGLFPENNEPDGFSDLAETFGGLLISDSSGYASLIPDTYYRPLLGSFATIKRNGLSLVALDNFCSLLTSGYTFSFSGPDIYVSLQSFTDTYTLSIAQYTMGLLAQNPQVFFSYSGINNSLLFFDYQTYPTIDNLEGLADDLTTIGGFFG
jgi:hypothetical protein